MERIGKECQELRPGRGRLPGSLAEEGQRRFFLACEPTVGAEAVGTKGFDLAGGKLPDLSGWRDLGGSARSSGLAEADFLAVWLRRVRNGFFEVMSQQFVQRQLGPRVLT